MALFKAKEKKSPMERELDKIFAETQKVHDQQLARQMKINTCYTQLKSCDRVFVEAIEDECVVAAELEGQGFVAEPQRSRIKQAAMGRIVVKRALIELKSVSTEQSLNKAINLLGASIRQMHRISNYSTEGISGRNRKAIQNMLPDSEDGNVFALVEDDKYPIPTEIADKVNDNFVQNLINGMDFEECMRAGAKAGFTSPNGATGEPSKTEKNKYADIINRYADQQ